MKQYIDKQDNNLAKCSTQSINYKYSTLKLGEKKSLCYVLKILLSELHIKIMIMKE